MTINPPVYFLLVDDLEENLLSLEALLRRDGLVLLKAKSGAQALELLLKHDVALAILDVQMPGMDGFELAQMMRGVDRTRRVPIVFLTAGTADRKRRFQGYEAGAVDFLHKPIETDILRGKADVFFELSQQKHILIRQRDELHQLAIALREADRRKDEFLATLAHELRNPLAPIRNGLQVLRMSSNAEMANEVRDMMDRQLAHMVRLIDDLLDVSRISKGKIDLRREPIMVESVLQAAIETSQPLIDKGHHHFAMELPEKSLWLHADFMRIAQVVSNLLNNAAKYTPEGGMITLSAKQEGGMIYISVADNGLGIPAEMLPKVFEFFTQVDRNLERSQGGLGIGLALVKRLVEMHGGKIIAQSEGLEKGSIFTVQLPAIEAPAESKAVEAEPLQSVQSLRILVVDDNIASAKTIGWMLEMEGHTASLAHNGPEAISMAKQLLPQVIMLDIGLPGMNGYDVCRALRSDPQFKETVMIAQTGWGQESDRKLAREAGFNHHLTKPVELKKLSALLTGLQATS